MPRLRGNRQKNKHFRLDQPDASYPNPNPFACCFFGRHWTFSVEIDNNRATITSSRWAAAAEAETQQWLSMGTTKVCHYHLYKSIALMRTLISPHAPHPDLDADKCLLYTARLPRCQSTRWSQPCPTRYRLPPASPRQRFSRSIYWEGHPGYRMQQWGDSCASGYHNLPPSSSPPC